MDTGGTSASVSSPPSSSLSASAVLPSLANKSGNGWHYCEMTSVCRDDYTGEPLDRSPKDVIVMSSNGTVMMMTVHMMQ
jgi:hypothetical protein